MPLDNTDVTGLPALPPLNPLFPADLLPVGRTGAAAPLYQSTVLALLAAIISLNPAGPLTGTEQTYIIQNGVPVLTDIINLAKFPPRQIGFVFGAGPPTTAQFLDGTAFSIAMTIPGNFAGAVGAIDVLPTSTFVILVKKNGANVGTISISTAGVFTFATTAGAAISMAVGDKLEFFAPVSVDATAAIFMWTIQATFT